MTIIDALLWLNETDQRCNIKLPLCSECGAEMMGTSWRCVV
jgi:hypothetical protein